MANRQYSFQTGTMNRFQTGDYVIFAGTLILSSAIGFFYAIKDRKQHSTKEFLLAGGNMHPIPVAMSLLASFMSAIALLGTPAEMYNFGTMYMWIGVSYFLAMGVAAHIYIPILYRLKITSAYEYLELRFSKGLRTMGTCVFVIQMMIYMSIVLYGPSLALNAVTGLSLWGAVISVGLVCTLYTAIGGMKAVLWTDTFQICIMIAGLLAALIQGAVEVGGFQRAWDIAAENDRVNFSDFSVDPSVRHSVWSLVIGGSFLWVSVYGTNQAQVQRAFTCKTLKGAQIAVWLNAPGLCVILYLCSMIGIVLYAFYSTCDPISFNLIVASDQLFPLFVMDILGHVPGLPGLFVACICSSTLSTISSGLNSLSTVVLKDIIRPYIAPEMSDEKATKVSKFLALSFGLMCLGLAFVASFMGSILQAGLALFGILGAPMLGIFTLGLLFPWANKWGAISGFLSSLLLMLWIGIGKFIYKPPVNRAPLRTDGCNWNLTMDTSIASSLLSLNATNFTQTMMYTEESFINSSSSVYTSLSMFNDSTISEMTTSAFVSNITIMSATTLSYLERVPLAGIYTLSYIWYSPVAVLVVAIVGTIVSLITGRQDPDLLDARLICPVFDVLLPCLPENVRRPLRFGVVHEGKYDTHTNEKESKSTGIVLHLIDDEDKSENPLNYKKDGKPMPQKADWDHL